MDTYDITRRYVDDRRAAYESAAVQHRLIHASFATPRRLRWWSRSRDAQHPELLLTPTTSACQPAA